MWPFDPPDLPDLPDPPDLPSLRERPVDRGTRLREELRAIVGDVQTVLEADAELAVDRDHRLVAEAHAGRERGRVALHEVRPLMDVEADAVAGAVRQPRHLVAGTEARVGDHLPRGGIDRFAPDAWLRGRERRRLRALLQI